MGDSVIAVSYSRSPRLDPLHDRLDHVDGNVLREHRHPAPPRHDLGHPPTCDGGHVGHHDRDRRADPVGRREIDREPAADRRPARHHEHVAVGEVVSGIGLQHAHRRSCQVGRHSLEVGAATYAPRMLPDVDAHSDATSPPVVLVHGWGGSFAATWQRSGFTDLLADAGREVIGIDLLGHGTAPKPHDPEAYDDLTAPRRRGAPGPARRCDRLLARRPHPVAHCDCQPGSLPPARAGRHRPQRVRVRRRDDATDRRRDRAAAIGSSQTIDASRQRGAAVRPVRLAAGQRSGGAGGDHEPPRRRPPSR